jgi:hypothetical protein
LDLVIEMLILLLERLRGRVAGDLASREQGDDVRNAIRVALDYCRLELSQYSAATPSLIGVDANRQYNVAALSRSLRHEIDRV